MCCRERPIDLLIRVKWLLWFGVSASLLDDHQCTAASILRGRGDPHLNLIISVLQNAEQMQPAWPLVTAAAHLSRSTTLPKLPLSTARLISRLGLIATNPTRHEKTECSRWLLIRIRSSSIIIHASQLEKPLQCCSAAMLQC